ncbi:MAG: hypothetical protein NC548_34920 [Lachnospiraceae bacterium]|nr:hypothetical protein [Lachnospiraceae bacterium]
MGARLGEGSISSYKKLYKNLDIPEDTSKGSFDASGLKGTEKQIKWAQSIIDDGYRTANAEILRARDAVEYYYKNINKHETTEWLARAAAELMINVKFKKKLDGLFDSAKTASQVIDHRRIITGFFPENRAKLLPRYQKEYEEKFKKKFKK